VFSSLPPFVNKIILEYGHASFANKVLLEHSQACLCIGGYCSQAARAELRSYNTDHLIHNTLTYSLSGLYRKNLKEILFCKRLDLQSTINPKALLSATKLLLKEPKILCVINHST
jgi:hypothetical protein